MYRRHGRAGEKKFDVNDVSAILDLQFSEPMPAVLARAKEDAKTLSLKKALDRVGGSVKAETGRPFGGVSKFLIKLMENMRDRNVSDLPAEA